MKKFIPYLSLPFFLIACASDDPGNMSTGSGGAADVLGSGGMLTTPSGGSSSGGATASTGGSSSGGAGQVNTGGMTATGGALVGSGGDDTGTGGDEMGTGGEMSGGGDPVASDGCGKANPQTGGPGKGETLNAGKLYYVKLPTNYDENNPYRVLFFFNPTGDGNNIDWGELNSGYEALAKDTTIRVYPHESANPQQGSSSGWGTDDIASFRTLYDAVVNNFCVDTTRVFAAGESSGGDFSSFIGCDYGDLIRGIGPAAPKKTGFHMDLSKCKGHPTAIIMYSTMDTILNTNRAGEDFTEFYRKMNGCEMTDTPVQGYTDDKSNCKLFNGCMAGSDTYHCVHNDPNYSGTHHGWPGMAPKMTWGVFEKL